MNDKELIVRLREYGGISFIDEAASRIEQLVAERDEAHDFALTVENIMAQYTGEHISAADACREIYEELHKLPAILEGR